jgi:hypothetical protein
VMPDHWHALIGLREPWTLPKLIHAFMSHVGATPSAHLTKHHTGLAGWILRNADQDRAAVHLCCALD